MSVILTLFGIIIGIVVTALVGRYYFHRTIDRTLTPFIYLNSNVLSGIDPQVRKDLKILYRDETVEDLTHLQLLIANTGTRAIRDCIKPFTVFFPKDVVILDHAILHRHPAELELTINSCNADSSGRESVQVHFLLLNRGDFFLIKFLIKGSLKTNDLDCRITVDDLPPKLEVTWLPISATKTESTKVNLDWSAFFVGLGLLAVATSIVYNVFILFHAQTIILSWNYNNFSATLINAVALLFTSLAILIFIFFGILLMINISFNDLFRSRQYRFPLPESLQLQPRIPQELAELFFDDSEMLKELSTKPLKED